MERSPGFVGSVCLPVGLGGMGLGFYSLNVGGCAADVQGSVSHAGVHRGDTRHPCEFVRELACRGLYSSVVRENPKVARAPAEVVTRLPPQPEKGVPSWVYKCLVGLDKDRWSFKKQAEGYEALAHHRDRLQHQVSRLPNSPPSQCCPPRARHPTGVRGIRGARELCLTGGVAAWCATCSPPCWNRRCRKHSRYTAC